MKKEKAYTAEEIDRIRGMIHLLSLADSNLGTYERMDINEKMLQIYLSQGITYYDLSVLFQEKLKNEKQKE